MAMIEVNDEQLSDIVAQELKWSIENNDHPMMKLEPELVDALWTVLEYFSIPSEFAEYKEKMKWKQQMENQV